MYYLLHFLSLTEKKKRPKLRSCFSTLGEGNVHIIEVSSYHRVPVSNVEAKEQRRKLGRLTGATLGHLVMTLNGLFLGNCQASFHVRRTRTEIWGSPFSFTPDYCLLMIIWQSSVCQPQLQSQAEEANKWLRLGEESGGPPAMSAKSPPLVIYTCSLVLKGRGDSCER
ncbi:hypothetical protein NPIL_556991 [Nephila pilipes]|uniref:Uncharacterized protein n=1 Tax=Nephila pilipes TaxID=299642 RepID=A0A8X6U0K1_NEPPI|nr:hypothetical protein NPIL_556991 [Nephila pilipes]